MSDRTTPRPAQDPGAPGADTGPGAAVTALPGTPPPVKARPGALRGAAAGPALRRLLPLAQVHSLGLLVVLVLLGVVGTTTSGNFLTGDNIVTILTGAAVIGVITVGQTFVIIGGGIDLSVGAIVAVASVWCTTVATQSHGLAGMLFTAVVVGAAVGLLNGLLIAYGRIVAFITTLAMMASARGVAERISDRQSQVVTVDSFNRIATDKFLGIPLLVYLMAAIVVLGWLLLNRTTFGRRTFAVGGNPEAARLAGIAVRRHTVLLYLLSGVCCGVAAVMLTARTTSGASNLGNLYELDSIAAVIIGGTLLAGGRGSLVGSILGVLVFTTITNIFVLNNLTTDIQEIAKGLIIIAAVLLQRFQGARSPA
ncbi:ABC transporter permease [Actinacidiphila epipremni]|uniref:ABC transporter permease n=1 Tax=Actinacidiphila epipremni TaxID=2053013 RepID=A0ABX1A163_9ACTN|nr:ABC transporter permease [Actinacidiphila epipremni]NJP47363.1 ABC transporter permease [Actinacidiphila epipremni]